MPNIPTIQYDTKFVLIGWDKWLEMFDNILLKRIDYYAEVFDCDNYAYLVSSLSSLFLLVNSCGNAHGQVFDKNTGKLITGHYFNIIVTKDNEVYLFDLNNRTYTGAGWAKVDKGKDPIIGNWVYKNIDKTEFF